MSWIWIMQSMNESSVWFVSLIGIVRFKYLFFSLLFHVLLVTYMVKSNAIILLNEKKLKGWYEMHVFVNTSLHPLPLFWCVPLSRLHGGSFSFWFENCYLLEFFCLVFPCLRYNFWCLSFSNFSGYYLLLSG